MTDFVSKTVGCDSKLLTINPFPFNIQRHQMRFSVVLNSVVQWILLFFLFSESV